MDVVSVPRARKVAALADGLLESRGPSAVRRLAPRERRAEAGVAAAFALTAAAMIAWLPSTLDFHALTAVLLVGCYALVARVTFRFGTGFARPTQLVFVPILFLLPAPAVPALVAAGSVLAAAPELVRRRCGAERLVVAIADSWYSVGPALVMALVGAPVPTDSSWTIFPLALGAQFATDLAASTVRERLGAGVSALQLAQVLSLVYLVDALLAPIGLLAVFASLHRPYAFLLVVPPGGVLAVVARERDRRIERELELGRAQRRAARRVGEAVAASFDRDARERVLLGTSAEALGADTARLSGRGADGRPVARVAVGEPEGLAEVLAAAEAAVLSDGGAHQIRRGRGTALAVHVGGPAAPGDRRRRVDTLAVARAGAPFSATELDLLEDLARQAAVSLENAALHELVERQAMTDELTGLLNHRKLQQVLSDEIAEARRTGRSLALLMLDIDDFKAINDTHGHRQGDRVLGDVAEAVRGASRPGDLAGRYGGEEMALVLPGTTLEEAAGVGERVRGAIASLRIQSPEGRRIAVTASVGVAAIPASAADRDGLIEAADAAMYVAKRGGKNRTVQAPSAGERDAARDTRAPERARA